MPSHDPGRTPSVVAAAARLPSLEGAKTAVLFAASCLPSYSSVHITSLASAAPGSPALAVHLFLSMLFLMPSRPTRPLRLFAGTLVACSNVGRVHVVSIAREVSRPWKRPVPSVHNTACRNKTRSAAIHQKNTTFCLPQVWFRPLLDRVECRFFIVLQHFLVDVVFGLYTLEVMHVLLAVYRVDSYLG